MSEVNNPPPQFDPGQLSITLNRATLEQTALTCWMDGFVAASGRDPQAPLTAPELRERAAFIKRFAEFVDRAITPPPANQTEAAA